MKEEITKTEAAFLARVKALCLRRPVIETHLRQSFRQGITPFLAAEIHDGAFKPAATPFNANPKKYRLQELPEIDAPQN